MASMVTFEDGARQGKLHVALANRLDPMPGVAHHAGDGGKRHLTAHRQNEGFKEQREPRKLARPIGLDENHRPSGSLIRGVRTSR